MPEIRWILLGLGLILITGIWWWGSRRSRQPPGYAELREPTLGSTGAAGQPSAPTFDDLEMRAAVEVERSREWGVPPFEPLIIQTADFEAVPTVDAADAPQTEPESSASPPARFSTIPLEVTPEVESSSVAAAQSSAAAATEAGDTQRIITIRVVARGEQRWAGPMLLAQLHENGLTFGRYHVFHRQCTDGRTLFCAASLVEPGTFDMTLMPTEEFRGVTLFAVLPGPLEPLQTLDELFATAHELAQALQGVVQDSTGTAFSAQRAEALRADMARFQASLP